MEAQQKGRNNNNNNNNNNNRKAVCPFVLPGSVRLRSSQMLPTSGCWGPVRRVRHWKAVAQHKWRQWRNSRKGCGRQWQHKEGQRQAVAREVGDNCSSPTPISDRCRGGSTRFESSGRW